MDKIQKIINEIKNCDGYDKKHIPLKECFLNILMKKLIENNIYFFKFTDMKYFTEPSISVISNNKMYLIHMGNTNIKSLENKISSYFADTEGKNISKQWCFKDGVMNNIYLSYYFFVNMITER